MPFSTDKSAPWEPVTEAWVNEYFGRLQRAASREAGLSPWVDKKFGRDESQTSFIIGQFQNDASIFSLSMQELIKHPNATVMQFRGDALAEIDMWRWVPSPQANSDSAWEKYEGFLGGSVVALDEQEKRDVLRNLKTKIQLIVGAHGAAVTETRADKQPVESAGGYSAEMMASMVEKVLQFVPKNAVQSFYTRFLVCNIAMPQEKVLDDNGFLGSYVGRIHQAHPDIAHVEASGAPFTVSLSSASTHTLRRVGDRTDTLLSADKLEELGWGRKFRVVMESGALSSSGSEVRLTAFEKNLAVQWRDAGFPNLIRLLDDAQSLLAKPGSSTADQRLAQEKEWEPLKFVMHAIPEAVRSGRNLWEGAEQIDVVGDRDDTVRIEFADGACVTVDNLARDLRLFKNKMLHFEPMRIPNEPDDKVRERKRLVQLRVRHFNAIETSFAPLDWPRADKSIFSCLAQLADYQTPEINLLLLKRDARLDQIVKDAIFRGTSAPPSTDIRLLAVRVMPRPNSTGPNRDLANRLATMDPYELSQALVFDVKVFIPGVSSGKKEKQFSADVTQKLLTCIDAVVQGTAHRGTLSRINNARLLGLRTALKDPQMPLPVSQQDIRATFSRRAASQPTPP